MSTRFLRDGLPLALAATLAGTDAGAQAPPADASPPSGTADAPLSLRPSTQLAPPARAQQGRRSVVLLADRVSARPDLETTAEGRVELRHAGTVIRADRVVYDSADDHASARGHVRISHAGNVYSGPELQLHVQRFEGFFLEPEFTLGAIGAGGRAERVDFIDAARSTATRAIYTSCPRDGSGDPDWLLSAERVRIDLEANEGIAERAKVRFLGVPILALPVLSFPLSDARKSGWLPPSVNLDSRSGLEVALPYYWNIAPNRDATITPDVSTRRGAALGLEYRYLEPSDRGKVEYNVLPHDRAADRSRSLGSIEHDGSAGAGLHYAARGVRVSDDAYWKDFPRQIPTFTPRLLPLALRLEQAGDAFGLRQRWYAGTQRWQVLQSSEPGSGIVAPYNRAWQLGAEAERGFGPGLQLWLQSELNRFEQPPHGNGSEPSGSGGVRWHGIAALSRRWGAPGWWLQPRLSVNAASYDTDRPLTDGRTRASRVIPTTSVDAGAIFERDSEWFGRGLRQTLEPRLLYVNTPFRAQAALPNYDSGGLDFNAVSIYSENAFAGIDRVSDAHQLTAGVTTRLLDPASGAETLRLGVAQRYLFRDQQITPDGVPLTQRLSDLLIEGSSALPANWHIDLALQYSAEIARPVRSIVGVRYQPAPFHALSTTYRFARGLSEQLELGWQWPVYRGRGEGSSGSGRCQGNLYAVGRVNYSMRDSRITDSIAGFEYDAGCWIVRVVGERLSTGRSEATTRLLLQLELVGLSRIGSNPLQVLKDNVPGYKLLREERSAPIEPSVHD